MSYARPMHGASRVEPGQPTTDVPTSPVADTPVHGITPARGPRAILLRFESLVRELGRFGVVGAIAYAVDTAILIALSAAINPLLAKTISTAVSATAAFVGNRYWTWRDRPRSGLHREYALYFFFNVVGLGIGLACLGVSHYLLGRTWPVLTSHLADVVSANVVGMVLGTLFRFWSYRRFVFQTRNVIANDASAEKSELVRFDTDGNRNALTDDVR